MILLFILSLTSAKLQASPIDLKSAFRSALKKNESPLIQDTVVRRAKEKKDQVVGGVLPHLSAVADRSYQDTSKLLPTTTILADSINARLTLTQPIFHGFRAF